MQSLSLEQFLQRVRESKRVSRFDFQLGFKWTRENAKALEAVVKEKRDKGIKSDLSGSDLSRSNLSGSNLSGSNLSWSDLSWSDLSRSNLSGSNLSGSNLSWSDLSRSNLSGSNLSRSNLSGSDLSDVRASVGFSFSLQCGMSLQSMLKDVKASVKVREYLQVQVLAHACWEDEKRLPFEFVRDYFTVAAPVVKGNVLKAGRKRKVQKVV